MSHIVDHFLNKSVSENRLPQESIRSKEFLGSFS